MEEMMPPENALALVVRGTDWSETSRIATLFTREFGKVRALAKGGRRLKSNFDVAFDLLSVCRIVFLRSASGGLDLLTEARMEERFPILRQNLNALYAGYYLAELLVDGTQDYDPHPILFEAALETLRRLGKQETATSSPVDPSSAHLASVTAFELVWLRELGYSPRLDSCAGCDVGMVAGGAGGVAYSPASGGVLCPACGPGASDRRWLSASGLATLRALIAAVEAEIAVLPSVSPATCGELRQVLGQTVSFVLGRRPRLLGYVEGR